MSEIAVDATRRHDGWEFRFGQDGVARGTTLAEAGRQIFDYIKATQPGLDPGASNFHFTLELGRVAATVAAAKTATDKADDAKLVADARIASAVVGMNRERYARADIAMILEIDRSRVDEILRSSDAH